MDKRALAGLLGLAQLPAPLIDRVGLAGGDPVLPTCYKPGEAGATAIGAAGLAAALLWELKTGRLQQSAVDVRAAALAMRSTHYLRIDGRMPPRDPQDLSGFYRLADGQWIFLHCAFANVRAANLSVLQAANTREDIARAVACRHGKDLEDRLSAAGGVGALARSESDWRQLPEYAALSGAPVLEIARIGDAPPQGLPDGGRPLSGIRVLDLTRVLAGPTCARTLAEHGADVLKISGPGLADSGFFDLDTGLGKRSAFVDLRSADGRDTLRRLAQGCDVFSQSYRPGSLAAKGFSPEELARLRPGIVCVELSAWSRLGPWRGRRGYDTVVQATNGMALGPDGGKPEMLPVSMQDYVAGYLLAYGAMVALRRRALEGGSWRVSACLSGVGQWIRSLGRLAPEAYRGVPADLPQAEIAPLLMRTESPAGSLTHLRPILRMSETPPHWQLPAVPLGHHRPAWD